MRLSLSLDSKFTGHLRTARCIERVRASPGGPSVGPLEIAFRLRAEMVCWRETQANTVTTSMRYLKPKRATRGGTCEARDASHCRGKIYRVGQNREKAQRAREAEAALRQNRARGRTPVVRRRSGTSWTDETSRTETTAQRRARNKQSIEAERRSVSDGAAFEKRKDRGGTGSGKSGTSRSSAWPQAVIDGHGSDFMFLPISFPPSEHAIEHQSWTTSIVRCELLSGTCSVRDIVRI